MFHIIPPGKNYDLVGKRKFFLAISGLALLVTFVLFFTKGLNFGIDFTGGAEIQVRAPQAWDIGKVRSVLEEGGVEGPKVVQIGEPALNEYLIRAQGEEEDLKTLSAQIAAIFEKGAGTGSYEITRSDVVGPAAGKVLRQQGALAMFYALMAILLYVAVRFDIRYAPGAVLALFHDSVITLGAFVVTQKQFDLTILAAILALIGYSNNDTIIIYDRVRETTYLHPNLKIEDAVNRAMNETLGRTLMTSITTLLVVVALYVFGGSVLENFAFTLLVGIIVGTYSSIFIASSVVISLTHYQKKRAARHRTGGKKASKYKVRPEPKAI